MRLLQGRLNPKERKLCITDWAGREVQDADIPYMAATLDSWLERCTGFVDSMSVAVNKYVFLFRLKVASSRQETRNTLKLASHVRLRSCEERGFSPSFDRCACTLSDWSEAQ